MRVHLRSAAVASRAAASILIAVALLAGCAPAPAVTAPAVTAPPTAPGASPTPVSGTPSPAPTPSPVPSDATGTPGPPSRTPAPPPIPTATAPAVLGSITGRALAGPTCPVAHYPPDPACADRPVPGVVIVVAIVGGPVVATVTTGPDGRYAVDVEPGTYTLTPQPFEGLLGTAAPVTIVVSPGATATVDFAYDTGIR